MNIQQNALEGLLSRYSLGIKHLGDPGPDDVQIEKLLAAALRAPDHERLMPWRMSLVRGAARQQLAELFEAHARLQGKSPESVALERERALKAPLTVAIIARIDHGHQKVPAHEQWITIGGAITNLLNAAHLMGFAAKTLSGDKVRAQPIVQAFCQPGEQLVAWVAIGTPKVSGQAHHVSRLSGHHQATTPRMAYEDWMGVGHLQSTGSSRSLR